MANQLQLEKYHEQAQLLDPHVTTIVERLTAVIRREALRGSQTNERTVQQAAEFLWALVTVRCTSQEAIQSILRILQTRCIHMSLCMGDRKS